MLISWYMNCFQSGNQHRPFATLCAEPIRDWQNYAFRCCHKLRRIRETLDDGNNQTISCLLQYRTSNKRLMFSSLKKSQNCLTFIRLVVSLFGTRMELYIREGLYNVWCVIINSWNYPSFYYFIYRFCKIAETVFCSMGE